MRIWRSVNTDRAGEIWSSTKTGEEREIILPESIAASLIRHRKIQAKEKLGAGASWRNPDLVFPNTKGGSTAAPPATRPSSATAREPVFRGCASTICAIPLAPS